MEENKKSAIKRANRKDQEHHRGACVDCRKKGELTTTLCCREIPVPNPRGHCLKGYTIDRCSFEKEGVNGIILSKPGTYKVTENLYYEPTKKRTTAITITACNVILELGTHTLKQEIVYLWYRHCS